MATIIFMLLFLTFTNILADNLECENESYCECSKNENNTHDYYISNKGVKYGINVISWSNIQIECNNLSWNDFNLTQIKHIGILDWIKFKNCTLPEETRLQYIVRKFGIKETNGLSFQSYRNLSNTLKKNHFLGFSSVTNLVLSYNGLTNISSDLFSYFPHLESLDLSENYLVLRKDLFNKTLNLKQLDLNGNGIKELPDKLFYNLKHLETLNLQRNLLKNLDEYIFDKLSSLKHLNLSSNLLLDLQQTIFYRLKKLETIDLSNNNFSILSSVLFIQNKKLKKIVISDNKSKLTTLPEAFLKDLENLEEIYLNKSQLYYLPEHIFWDSKSLKCIDLSDNNFGSIPEFIFLNLKNLEYLSIRNNRIQIIPNLIFKFVKNLKTVDLSFNSIHLIQRVAFDGLTSLRELNMEGNDLKYIDIAAFSTNKQLSIAKFSNNILDLSLTNKTTSPFYSNRLLKELHLSNNSIKTFYSDWTINKAELELLDLSHNNISVISANDYFFSSNKLVVDLRHNNISKIVLNDILEFTKYHTEKRHVVVHVDHNPILCDCSLYDVVRYSNGDMPITVYNFFELKLGNVTCVKPNGTQGPQINQLNYKTYQCLEDEYFKTKKMCLPRCTCNVRPYDKTRVLDCSYIKLILFIVDSNNIILEGSYPLILNFTGNFLTLIPSLDEFQRMNITQLLLSNNKISKVSLNKIPKNIQVLELHNNNLVNLNYDVSEYLFNQNYQKLTLSGNPFLCDCDSRFLYLLVIKKQDTYKDLKNVKCKDHNIALIDMTVDQLCPSNVPPHKFVINVE